MTEKNVVVGLIGGLDARALAKLVQLAGQYVNCSVVVEYKGRQVNAKSIMGMMSLGIAKGEELSIRTEGDHEEIAADKLEKYLTNGEEN